MTRDWFCQVAGKNYGPLTFEQLQRMAKAGQLPHDAPVRQGEEGQWYYAGTMPGIFPAPAPAAEPAPPAAPHKPARPKTQQKAQQAAPQTARAPAQPSASPDATTSKFRVDNRVPKAKPLTAGNPQGPSGPAAAAPPPRTRVAPAVSQHEHVPAGSIPAGSIPMGGIPTGTPLIPQGMPMMPSAPMPPPPVMTAPASVGGGKKGAGRTGKRANKNRNLIIAVGGGGGAAVIAFILVLVFNSGTSTAKKEAPRDVAATEAGPIESPAESPTGESATKPAAADKKKPEAKKDAASKKSAKGTKDKEAAPSATVSLEKTLSQITKWTDLAKANAVTVKSSGVKVQVVSVWTDGASSPDGEAAKPASNRVYIEMSVSNPDKSKTPITYSSWNSKTGPGTQGTVLADDQYRPGTLVANNKTPAVTRQSAPLRLPPDKVVADVLVFEMTSRDFEFLYLVLPFSAIGPGEKPFAFKIPKSIILPERPKDAPAQLAKTGEAPRAAPVEGAVAAGEPTEPAEAMPAPAKAPVTPTPKREDDNGPSAAELNKQILEMQQKEKQEKEEAKKAKGE